MRRPGIETDRLAAIKHKDGENKMQEISNEIIIRSQEDLVQMVEAYGFLPLFRNHIAGFSVEDHTPPELWFADDTDGPWEWKGPVIQETGCAYGKFFRGKAGFISRSWFPDFANYRRDGYDFDARYNDGLARYQDKIVYDVLTEHSSLLSKEWRKLTGIPKRGTFDATVARLQMQGYVTTIDFEYAEDRNGHPYGWGVARYATPELYFGADFREHLYDKEPEESKALILDYLQKLLPGVSARDIMKIIG